VAFEIMAVKPAEVTATNPLGGTRATSAALRANPEYKNRWFTTSTNASRVGDSIYLPIYADRFDWIIQFPDNKNDQYLANRYNGMTLDNPNFNDNTINISSTGSFYLRADAPAHLLGYHEMCFIKAEVLFRKGDVTNALAAYKAGIRAHMEAMNAKLKDY